MGINRKKSRTIFQKIFRPVLMVFLIIIGMYSIVLQKNVLRYLKDNAVQVFDKHVTNRKLQVENQMNSRWSDIGSQVEQVVRTIEETMEQKGAAADRIAYDSDLNQEILQAVMEDVINTLRISGASEVFLVLDGNVSKQEKEYEKAGIYLRTSDPSSYSDNNRDILLERGIPAISKKWKFPLDSFWTTGFCIDEESDFFHKPIHAARESENQDFLNFVYWSYGNLIHSADKGILSYTVPLITSGGSVIGVMGIGINEDYFVKNIDYEELTGNRTGAYLLAKTTDGVNYIPVICNGTAYNKTSFIGQPFEIRVSEKDDIPYLYSEKNRYGNLCVSMQKLNLYNHNTPFEQEQWVLMGTQPKGELLATYNKAGRMLLLLGIGGSFLSLFALVWTNRVITIPIQRLVDGLKKSDPYQPIRLQRVNVDEIDALAVSVEQLSSRVAAAYSKISVITRMSESGIGVYEYDETENLVFCSRGFYRMLGWSPEADSDAYQDGADFCRRMEELQQYRVPGEENLYKIPTEDGAHKWIKLNLSREDNFNLGVLKDVTSDVLEKQQIEYERDYDILTTLYNRRGFEDQMELLFQNPEGLKKAVLLVWDLDNLKYVNDTYGHIMGDEYIKAFADCLKFFDGANIISARRSGDEFVTLLYGSNLEEQLFSAIQDIWEKIKDASICLPGGNTYKLRVSAGAAWYPKDADNYEKLFQFADFAMYTVKHSRKGTMEVFNHELYKQNKILLQGQEALHNLLEKQMVRFMLQPIISAADGEICGYEMLMRSEVELFRSPLDILRMAHSQSKLYDLEVMTWFEAMRTFAELAKSGNLWAGSRIFINSISNQIMHSDMVEVFESVYKDYLTRIVCEFTEEEQNNPQITRNKVELMRKWGAMTAVDDYGCGYNSESVLLDISPDIVKIDMNIVRGIHADENRQQLVKNLILYAKERNIKVLGEGVETKEEVETLILLGVDLLQGYYIAWPSYEGTAPTKEVCNEITGIYQEVTRDRKISDPETT